MTATTTKRGWFVATSVSLTKFDTKKAAVSTAKEIGKDAAIYRECECGCGNPAAIRTVCR